MKTHYSCSLADLKETRFSYNFAPWPVWRTGPFERSDRLPATSLEFLNNIASVPSVLCRLPSIHRSIWNIHLHHSRAFDASKLLENQGFDQTLDDAVQAIRLMQKSNISIEVADTELDDVDGADAMYEDVQTAFNQQDSPSPAPQEGGPPLSGGIMQVLGKSCCLNNVHAYKR